MTKPDPKPPRRSRVTVPERCHPAAQMVFAEMQRQGITYEELEWKSGVLKTTFKAWRTHNKPNLDTMEACLGALGWHFLPVPKPEKIPPEVLSDLTALAEKWALDAPLVDFIAACAARQPNTANATERHNAKIAAFQPLHKPRPNRLMKVAA